MFVKLLLVFCVIFHSKTQAQTNISCRVPRNGTCMVLTSCSYYMDLLKQKPRRRSLLTEVRKNMCGSPQNQQIPKVCCPQTDDSLNGHENFSLLPMDICGPIAHGTRIISGSNASPREFPWMALIAYKTGDSDDDQDFKCGGTLITERYVLTAAHCLNDKSLLGIRLGEYDIALEKECYHRTCEPPVQDILIEKIIMHNGYNPSTHVNDIALIRLATPANMANDNIKPICLPTGNLLSANLLGKFLTVTGWGTTDTGHKSTILNKVSIPVVSLKDCRKVYGKFGPILKTQVCAGGYKGRDSCSGDSGGPLQYIASMGQFHRYVQDGIVSYGAQQCGLEGWPGVYTNVKEYMSWILDNIEP